MNDKTNIREIEQKPDELMGAVQSVKRNIGAYLEMADVMADIRRAHYDAYIRRGFTEDQAIELSKKVTL